MDKQGWLCYHSAMNAAPQLSLILTTYNDAGVLAASLPVIDSFFRRTAITHELIVVDDGSTAPVALQALEQLRRERPDLVMLSLPRNCGRGAAVKEGLRRARGVYAGFIDNDLEIPVYYLLPMLQVLETGADVVLASRVYTLTLRNSVRYVLTKGYAGMANLLLGLPDLDTETGAKLFRREKVLTLLPLTPNDRWFWDTEIVFQAHRAGLDIRQVAIALNKRHDVPTSVDFLPAISGYLRDLLRLAWRSHR